jgi:hypothetical protein
LSSIAKIDNEIYNLASNKQKFYIDAVRKFGSNNKAARHLGVNESTIRSALKIAVKNAEKRYIKGLPNMPVGETKKLGKITTQLSEDGSVKNVWYRQDDDINALYNSLQNVIEDLTTPAPKVNTPKHTNSDLLTSYNIGDMHIAMHSWHEETGNDFDVNIATGDLTNAMADLIGRSLPSETCIILNLGDAIHFHDDSHSTKLSKNPLDADTRVDKAFRITCVLMNKFVEMALQKHKKVIVRNVLGNHDMELAMALRYQMDAYWRNEKRVSIEMSPADCWFYEFGQVMLMATHGHNMKPEKMIPYMSARMPEMWGRCKLRRALHGHFHSKSIIEGLGGKVEGFSNLAPNDAWHESKGYRSELECVAVFYHKCGKEVGRQNYMLHHDEVGNSDNAGMLGRI